MRPTQSRQSESFEKKRYRRKVVGTIALVVSIPTWIFIFARLSSLPSFAVNSVNVYGAPAEIIPAIEKAAYSAMNGDYLGIFARSNALIYPNSHIASAIGSVSPLIDAVTVRLDGMNTLAISISEKTPDAVVCADLPDLSETDHSISEEKCYLVDAKGFIFSPVGQVTTKNYNRYYMPDLVWDKDTGTYATSTTGWKAIQAFVNGAKSAQIEVIATLMKDGGKYEIYAHNPSTPSIVVIHATDQADLVIEQENLLLFWNKMLAESRAKKTLLEWNEIKLQYPPNVYYTEAK